MSATADHHALPWPPPRHHGLLPQPTSPVMPLRLCSLPPLPAVCQLPRPSTRLRSLLRASSFSRQHLLPSPHASRPTTTSSLFAPPRCSAPLGPCSPRHRPPATLVLLLFLVVPPRLDLLKLTSRSLPSPSCCCLSSLSASYSSDSIPALLYFFSSFLLCSASALGLCPSPPYGIVAASWPYLLCLPLSPVTPQLLLSLSASSRSPASFVRSLPMPPSLPRSPCFLFFFLLLLYCLLLPLFCLPPPPQAHPFSFSTCQLLHLTRCSTRSSPAPLQPKSNLT